MITKEEYLKAVEIVEAYHNQVNELISRTSKITYRNLSEVMTGDIVKVEYVHSASEKHLTKDKEYDVLNTDYNRFLIKCDSGVKKWYYNSNGHFKLV